jgi:hypothetical protein
VFAEVPVHPPRSQCRRQAHGRALHRGRHGGALRARWIPNERGTTNFEGFYINDQIFGGPRHRATYQQVQTFQNGMRLVADLNEVSDFDFLTDYEREIGLASSPQVLARLEVVRNGPWTSLNVRELRREQLLSGTPAASRRPSRRSSCAGAASGWGGRRST